MPPSQCPSCGRFLSNALVGGLADSQSECPRCGERLTASMFAGSDPLANWDVGADVAEVGAWSADRPPFPVDGVVVLGAGTAGLLVGLLVDRRPRGAAVGTVLGLVGAAVARKVWRLE